MRKIAIGIIAVFIVQVGFQFYTVAERTNSSYTQIASIAPLSEMPLTTADVETVYFRSAVESAGPRRESRATESYERRSTHPARPSAKELTAKKPLFPPVIITIPEPTRYEIAAYKPDTSEPAATKPLRPLPIAREKRSLSSKAFSVAKKPYDLLKFVASKLM
jgi:hypothetical protein